MSDNQPEKTIGKVLADIQYASGSTSIGYWNVDEQSITDAKAALSAMVAEIIGEDVMPYVDPFLGDSYLSGKDHYDNNIKNEQRQRAIAKGFML